MRYLTCEPDTEIIGYAIRAFAHNVRGVSPLLKKHNLSEIELQEWYPLQNWVNVLNDLNETNNGMTNYFAMGTDDAKKTELPHHSGDIGLPLFLEQWGTTYLMQHRGTNIGSIVSTKLSDKHYQLSFNVTYPDDYICGMAHGIAQRLLPMGTYFKVWYDTAIPRLDQGGTETVINIRWD